METIPQILERKKEVLVANSIKLPLIQKINELHNKNVNKKLKSISKIGEMVRQHIENKNHYNDLIINKNQQKIHNNTLNNLTPTKSLSKHSKEKLQKNSKQKYIFKKEMIDNQRRKIHNKLIKAEKRKNQLISLNKTSIVVDKRWIITFNKQQQSKRSQQLFTQSNQKIIQAQKRRSDHKQRKILGLIDSKILIAKKRVQANKILKQNQSITKIVRKHKKFCSSTEKLNKDDIIKISLNKKQNKIKQKNILIKRLQQKQKQEKKKEQNLKKTMYKIQKSNEKREQQVKKIVKYLTIKQQQKKIKAKQKIKQIYQHNRLKKQEINQKYHQQWAFLTSLKKQKDQLIQSNIFLNNKLSLSNYE